MYELVGIILGTIGTVLVVLNYIRDKHNITVDLLIDWKVTHSNILFQIYDENKKYCVLDVINIGRRVATIRVSSLIFLDGSHVQFGDALLYREHIGILSQKH